MDGIGKGADKVLATIGATMHSSLQKENSGSGRRGKKPPLVDRETDFEIPARVFSAWKPDRGPREIIRALTDDERRKLSVRESELRDALYAYSEDDGDLIEAMILTALSGFRSFHPQDTEGQARTIRHILREFPQWAISEGCARIARGDSGLDPRFPPNDPQIYEVVAGIVKDYRKALASAKALLAAPVERRDEIVRLSRAEIREQLGREMMERRQPTPEELHVRELKEKYDRPEDGDGNHAERVAADLAARKARNEAYRKVGIDPLEPNPDGSDYHLMNVIDAKEAP